MWKIFKKIGDRLSLCFHKASADVKVLHEGILPYTVLS